MSAIMMTSLTKVAAFASHETIVRRLGLVDYHETWKRMRGFTAARTAGSADELWLVQHPAVFTLGQAGKHEHVLNAGAIPVVNSDRGGQVTYHGPGQVVLYCLLDLRRLRIGVRSLVESLEGAVINSLAEHGLCAQRREAAPGVYVADAKIAALGLRVRNACTYHGVALNVRMDLEPFARINPCGFAGLRVTSMYEQGIDTDANSEGERLALALAGRLGVDLRDGTACDEHLSLLERVDAAPG
jgi:lipoyl(octanoyl) transferase